jgi:hypothetical protein
VVQFLFRGEIKTHELWPRNDATTITPSCRGLAYSICLIYIKDFSFSNIISNDWGIGFKDEGAKSVEIISQISYFNIDPWASQTSADGRR